MLIPWTLYSFLHQNRIRHKDIKPSNILVRNSAIYITGLRQAAIYEPKDDHTATSGPMIARSTYSPAEEIYITRNLAADIFSLGCVYLEMWAVLREASKDLSEHMAGRSYSSIVDDLEAWIARTEALPGPPSDNLPIEWIRKMLQRDPTQRPTAQALRGMIQEASAELDAEHMFIGQCCLDEDTESTYENAKSDIGDDQQDDNVSGFPSSTSHQEERPPNYFERRSSMAVPQATRHEDRRLISARFRKSSV